MAHWLIQTNIGLDDYRRIADALTETDASWSKVSLLPFTNNVQGLPHDYRERPCVPYGSVNLARWGRKKHLRGVWWDDAFSFVRQRIVYGDEMLNADAKVSFFDQIEPYEGDRFIRPEGDGKAFTGEIIGYQHLAAWQDRIRDLNADQLSGSTVVLTASVKPIFREYRFFIVAGDVATPSVYREDGRVLRRPLDEQDAPVVEYVRRMVGHAETANGSRWPAPAFVMDVAVLDDGTMKIVEFNNINACGLYAADAHALVRAVDQLLPGR